MTVNKDGLTPIEEYKYLEVDQYARQAVRNTKSFAEALAYSIRTSKLFNVDEDVAAWVLEAIDVMYQRHGKLTIGKPYNKKPSEAGGDF